MAGEMTAADADRANAGDRPGELTLVTNPSPLRWLVRLLVLYLAVFVVYTIATNDRFQWGVVGDYFFDPTILAGVRLTVILTVVCMALGIVLGLIVAIMRMSTDPTLRSISIGFSWAFLGTPALVQLLFFYNIAALFPTLSIGIPFGPTFASADANDVITPMAAAVIGLGLHEAAYMAEIFRGSISGIDRGQREAGQALGMSQRQTFRRVVLPQAVRLMIPPTGSRVIGMLKYTSLVSVLGLSDLLFSAEKIYAKNFLPIPLLIVAVGWYLILTSALMLLQYPIERRFSRQFRPTVHRPTSPTGAPVAEANAAEPRKGPGHGQPL